MEVQRQMKNTWGCIEDTLSSLAKYVSLLYVCKKTLMCKMKHEQQLTWKQSVQ